MLKFVVGGSQRSVFCSHSIRLRFNDFCPSSRNTQFLVAWTNLNVGYRLPRWKDSHNSYLLLGILVLQVVPVPPLCWSPKVTSTVNHHLQVLRRLKHLSVQFDKHTIPFSFALQLTHSWLFLIHLVVATHYHCNHEDSLHRSMNLLTTVAPRADDMP